MDDFLKISALILLCTVFVLLLQKQTQELSFLLVLACSLLAFLAILQFLEPILDFVTELRILGKLDQRMVRILVKTAGIGLVTEFTAAVCTDAGEGALGKIAGLCGSAAALYLALPLLTGILELIAQWTEG